MINVKKFLSAFLSMAMLFSVSCIPCFAGKNRHRTKVDRNGEEVYASKLPKAERNPFSRFSLNQALYESGYYGSGEEDAEYSDEYDYYDYINRLLIFSSSDQKDRFLELFNFVFDQDVERGEDTLFKVYDLINLCCEVVGNQKFNQGDRDFLIELAEQNEIDM